MTMKGDLKLVQTSPLAEGLSQSGVTRNRYNDNFFNKIETMSSGQLIAEYTRGRNETTSFKYTSTVTYGAADNAPDRNFVDVVMDIHIPKSQEIIYVP